MSKKIIFGTGQLARKVTKHIDRIDYYIDNDVKKKGKLFLGKEVKLPQSILDEQDGFQVIIASSYYKEIKEQLLDMNLIESVDFVNYDEVIVDLNEGHDTQLFKELENKLECAQILMAKRLIECNNQKNKETKLSDVEFKVFSQWGEDGIIQYLINKIDIPNKVFVEFGVEDYKEANTRFLLINNNWSGTIIEMDKNKVDKIKSDDIYYKYDLTVMNNFITKDNINEIILNSGISGDIGLLSIDIDGNDYWVWREIEVVSPRIVICEYNNLLGLHEPISIPYKADFYRTNEHYSNLYYGANLLAMVSLAKEKGYKFLGTNSIGTNAFFVREDIGGDFLEPDLSEYNFYSKVRESRNENGELTYLNGIRRVEEIEGLPIYKIENERLGKVFCDSKKI